jgi:hypothetical protein
MTSRISPIAAKLEKLVPMLSSDKPGEVNAAVAAIGRTLKAAGADWHDLAKALTKPGAPARGNYRDRYQDHEQGDWRPLHGYCRQHSDALSSREQDFMTTLDFWRGNLTEKQRAWLEAIHARLRRAGL